MLFKKQKIGGLIISLSLLALAGCASKPLPVKEPVTEPVVQPPPVPEPSPFTTYSGDTWELTVPSTVDRKPAKADALLFAGFDVTEKRLFALIREEVKGTSATDLDAIAAKIKASFKEDDVTVMNESRGTVHGVPFIRFEAYKAPMAIYSWVLVKSDNAYLFTCGGFIAKAAEHAGVCTKAASTLKLK